MMTENSNNDSANNFASQDAFDTLQVPNASKQTQVPRTRNPFKIRKKTTVGFERAEWEAAHKNVQERSVKYYKGQIVPYNIELSNVRIYGPGIYLFFRYAKLIVIVFAILSLISLIPLIYNGVVGESYDTISDSISKRISIFTIGNLTPEGQRFSSLTDKLINAIPTVIISLLLFAFLVYWTQKSKEQLQFVNSFVKMLSYQVVEVTKFPENMTEAELFHYMSQWGEIKEISAVLNYEETIYYCKKIFQKTLKGKQIVLEKEKKHQDTNDQKFEQQLSRREKELQELYQKLSEEEQKSSKKPIKYYVTYQSPQQRQKALKVFEPFIHFRLPCFKIEYPEDLKLNGEQMIVKPCHTQPAGIIWQNAHVTWKTRWIRLALQSLLILSLLAIGFLFILYISVLEAPSTTSSVDSSTYDEVSILTVSDIKIVRSWCLDNSDLVEANLNTAYGQLCEQYVSTTVISVIITISISIAIILIKLGLKHLVIYLSKFMRYKTIAQETYEMTKNLFITYLCTTIIITILMRARFGTLVPKNIMGYLTDSQKIQDNVDQINEFEDITSFWYLDVGYQIWITWLILAITPISLIFTYHLPLRCLTHYLARKQVLQRKMQYFLEAEEFQIFDHYANIALIMFVGLVFSPGIPFLLPLATLGLLIRFLYVKYIFINFSKIPKPLDESLNKLMHKYMVLALIFHLLMAIWMYGVDELFDHSDSFLDEDLHNDKDSDFQKFWLIFFKRCIDSWYITAVLVAYLFFFFVRHFLRDAFNKCCGKKEIYKAPQQMLKDTVGNGGYVKGLASERTLAKSYKIQNNPEYLDILAIIQRKQLACTFMPSKIK